MMNAGFKGILGHEEEKRQLMNAVAHNRVSQAYLFSGETGSGKKALARAFALSLVCEHPENGDACLTCEECRKAIDGNHPDIIMVTHEKKNLITVDEIRHQVVDTVDILPYDEGRKVYIIPDAEMMNAQAQNALLKTIEEPPAYAVIILLTNSPEALLPTIKSRCVKIAMKPLSDAQISEYLENELHLPDYESRVLTAFAQGNLGKAKKAATEDSFSSLKDSALGLVRHLKNMDTAAMLEAIRQLKDNKDEIYDYLDILLMWFRDVLYYKATADIDSLIFQDEISEIRAEASGSSYEGIQEVLDAIDKCRVRLRANVNFDLALELLMSAIKENIHG